MTRPNYTTGTYRAKICVFWAENSIQALPKKLGKLGKQAGTHGRGRKG